VPTEVRRDVRLAAGGATLAAVAGERRVGVWRIADGRQLAMLVAPGPVHDLAFDPAGLRIAVAGDGGAGIWDLDGRVLATVSHIGVSRVAWSPDGQRLASAGGDGYARVWDADGGLPLQVLGQVGSSTDEMRFSPAGDRLAVHSSTGMLTYWDTRVDARPLADALALADRSAFLLEGTTLVSHPRMAPPEAEQPRDRRTRQLLAMVLDRRYHEAALGFAEAQSSQDGAEALFMAAAAASAAGNVGEATRRLAEYRRTGAAPAPRHAGDRLVTIEEIRRRYELGQDYYEKRRYAESAAEFLGAAMVTQVPSLYFNAAVSLEKLNRPEEAAAYFRRYLALAPNARDRERTQARIAVLEASE